MRRDHGMDLTVVHSRFRTMEAASLRLQKEAKGYLDSLRGLSSQYPEKEPSKL